LVKNLARIDTDHEFELFTDISDEKTLSEIKNKLEIGGKENFNIISLPAGKFKWNFWTLSRYLRKNPVDIYHTQYITPWFVPKRIKIVTVIHDISFNFFPKFIRFSDLFFLKTLIPISLKRADKIIAVSEFTKNEIVKFYKIAPEKVEVVHNSVGEEFLADETLAAYASRVADKYGLPEKFILYIGTLQPRKNIPMLISAYAKTKKRLDGIKLVICGNKNAHNFDKRIEEIIKVESLEKDVLFPGFIDENDKIFVYRLAHAFVLPSLYEGFGIPLLEAMSQDVPVLSADITSLREVAQKGALYFDTSSLDDFSKKLYDISMDSNLRRELTNSGKTRVSSFSWQNSAKKTLAIYDKLYHNEAV